MVMPNKHGSDNQYRYGFQGQEKTDELQGDNNHYTAMFWEYSPRVARRWNQDPIVKYYESPYVAFANNPISYIDPNGADTLNGNEVIRLSKDVAALSKEIKKDHETLEEVIKERNRIKNEEIGSTEWLHMWNEILEEIPIMEGTGGKFGVASINNLNGIGLTLLKFKYLAMEEHINRQIDKYNEKVGYHNELIMDLMTELFKMDTDDTFMITYDNGMEQNFEHNVQDSKPAYTFTFENTMEWAFGSATKTKAFNFHFIKDMNHIKVSWEILAPDEKDIGPAVLKRVLK